MGYDLHDRLCRRRGQHIGRKEQKYARAKGLYEADRKTLIKSSQHNPILKTLYEKLPPEKAHELLHVHYPQPEKMISKLFCACGRKTLRGFWGIEEIFEFMGAFCRICGLFPALCL